MQTSIHSSSLGQGKVLQKISCTATFMLEKSELLVNPQRASIQTQHLSVSEWGGGGRKAHFLEEGACSDKWYFFI